MLINDKEAAKRLNSPTNLINRLKSANGGKKSNAMALFGIRDKTEAKPIEAKPVFNPFAGLVKAQPPVEMPEEDDKEPITTDEILANPDSKIKLSIAHDKALELLTSSVEMLSLKLAEVSPSKLPSVIAAASKTVESIRKERLETSKNNKDQEVHYHFYTPERKKLADYEIVDMPA